MGSTTTKSSPTKQAPAPSEDLDSMTGFTHPALAAYSPSLSRGTPAQNVWCGEWTYIIKNQVHSFDITVEHGRLIYTENMGSSVIRGKVALNSSNKNARIIAKQMQFEIDIDRMKMMARYRTIGSKKWTKKIPLMKVDEIDDTKSESGCSLSWNKSTLRNTWKNTPFRDHSSTAETPDSASAGKVPRDRSMRGCSIRKMASMRKYTTRQESTQSDDVEELFRKNSTRRSIRFAEDVKNELLEELACEAPACK
jgi:hypothetical protein